MIIDAGLFPETGKPIQRLHPRTVICVAAMTFLHVAHVFALVGSGILAQAMTHAVGGITQSAWLSSIITITIVALNPPLGQVADYWGRKWIIVGTSAMGIIGALIISRAQNFATLLVGFAFMGLSFGSLSILMSVISEVLPRRHRPWGQGLGYMGGSLGGITGILLAGALLNKGAGGHLDNQDYQHYRIYWYACAGIFTLATLCCVVGYNPPPRNLQLSLSASEKLRQIDWIGYLLFAPGLALFFMSLAWINNPYVWNDTHVLAPFFTGLSMMILFVIYEWRLKTGMLHRGLWQHRNFPISLFLMFVEGVAFFSVNGYFVRKLTQVYEEGMLSACVNFLLIFLTVLVFAPVFGQWSSRFKALRAPMVTGSAFLFLFFVLIAVSKSDAVRVAFWVYPILGGIGLSSVLPLSMVACQMATPPELITIASSLMVSMRGFGGAVGIAVINTIFNTTIKDELPDDVGAAITPLPNSSFELLIKGLESGNMGAVSSIPGITPQIAKDAIKASEVAYSDAFSNVWFCAAVFCFLMVIFSCFLKEQKDEFNDSVDAPIELEVVRPELEKGPYSPRQASDEETAEEGTDVEYASDRK